MTLIVARKIGNKIIINSDTRLTYPKVDQYDPDPKRIQHHRPSEGTIKTINLTPDVNLSFAGNVSIAERVLSYFPGKIGERVEFNINNLIGHLHYLHIESNQETDFILSIGSPEESHSKIFSIKDGSVSDVNVAWIGSYDAFRIYQETFIKLSGQNKLNDHMSKDSSTLIFTAAMPTQDKELNEIYTRSHFAMRDVVWGEKIEDVGGFVISSVFNGYSFKYCGYFECYPIGFGRTKSLLKGVSTIPVGSNREGSFAVSVGSSVIYRLPIYFPHGNFGMIYSREQSALMEPMTFCDVSAKDFQEILRIKGIPDHLSIINFEDDSFTFGKNT
ncbi:hypothetical protein [Pseudoalteromonas aliena]|uniref:Uncharacterized protein n=1 Tax=Pseudoalteromonas aliena SW19 TaxID=1314866 RepID=A0ABR9DYE5_9GAMM|nr:hypothetical protein [Pseudoalteromonas aliena]MBE0359218.1 hypothetical protein [Pseudoalteromonas aliena SW19]